jgi:predicted MPP superfamily phosphohydrolase
MFYVLLALVLWDGARLVRFAGRRLRAATEREAPAVQPHLPTQTRRVFVARGAAAGACVAAAGVAALGTRSALYEITTPEVAIGLARFPRELDGYQIALLSDVHIGPTLDGRFLRSVVEQTNAMRPDLIAIVGDLVDGSVAGIGSQVAELARLRARHGVYFVTGNHEYYSGADEWVAFLRRLGIQVLMNERVVLGDARAQFDLAGLPDLHARREGALAPDASAAAQGRDDQRELIMLAHQPLLIGQSAAVGAGLQLSGHTHGGQLYPFGALTVIAQPYLAGLHRHDDTDTQIYVSRGTGFWGPPMRVLAPAEISRLRLHSV